MHATARPFSCPRKKGPLTEGQIPGAVLLGMDVAVAVAALAEAVRPAEAALAEAVRPAEAAYDEAVRPAEAALAEAVRPAVAAYDEAVRPAEAALAEAVRTDPLCSWIVEHALPDYRDEALAVLAALPCTLDQLDALADDRGWCSTWGEWRSRAIAAGVVPQGGASE